MTLHNSLADKLPMAMLRPIASILLLLAFTACTPSVPATNPAYYMGETYLRRGQLDKAVDAYKVFLEDPGQGAARYMPRAYYMLAFAYYRQGRQTEALETLDELERRYPELESVQVWTLRGDVSRDLGYRVQALQEYDEAWRFAGQMDRVRLETRFNAVLKEMSTDELAQAERLISDPALHESTAQALVASGGSLIAADDEAAREEDLAVEAAAPEPILRTDERREKLDAASARRQRARSELPPPAFDGGLAETAPEPEPEPEPEQPAVVDVPAPGTPKVACVAPLTGPGAAIGQQVCAALDASFSNDPDRVVAHDAGETVNAARAAWITAAEDPNVVAVVTWLPPESVQAIAAMAEVNGLPTIMLSGAAAGTEGPYVHAWGPSRSQEIDTLANYMLTNVHISRFGVLYPDTTSGNDYLDRLTLAVRDGGANVVARQFYRPGKGDWSTEIGEIKKWRQRDINVEAVFIPDDLGDVADLVAEVNRRWPDLIVLGLSSWSGTTAPLRAFVAGASDTGASGAGAALQGAIVGGGANSRGTVEARLQNVDTATAASGPPTVLRMQGGAAEPVGG